MADRFWVGGTGNWSDTAHWSTTSGGAGGASVPTSSDNAIFNSLSSAVGYTVTFNTTIDCLDLTLGAPATGALAISSGATCRVWGSLVCGSGLNAASWGGVLEFRATSGSRTVTMNGVVPAGGLSVTFNCAGATYTLQDSFSFTGVGTLTLSNGTLDTNGVAVTVPNFVSTTGTRTLTLGATQMHLTNNGGTPWNVNSGLTLNANTSTLFADSGGTWNLGGKTYNNVTVAVGVTFSDAGTFNNLTFDASTSGVNTLTLGANITVTGTFTSSAGANPSLRNRVISNTIGTARTITAAAVSLTDADFRDITAAGAAAPFTGTRLGDRKGNSSITFPGGVTRYWVGGPGTWAAGNQWATTSGGAGSISNFPLPQDSAVIDANSFSSNGTLNLSSRYAITNLNFTGLDQTVTLSLGSFSVFDVQGDITFAAGLTVSMSSSFGITGRTAQALTFGGVTLSNCSFAVASPGGSLTLQDGTSSGQITWTLTDGTLDFNDKNVTHGNGALNVSGTGTKVLDLGASTLTFPGTSSATPVNISGSGLTLIPGTSTIVLSGTGTGTRTFAGNGNTFNNLLLSGTHTGTIVFSGSNTFNDFASNRTIATTIQFTAGTTTTVASWNVEGSSGNVVTIGSTSAANHNLAKSGGGIIETDFLSISRSQASPANTWYAGTNSTNGGNNSGWIFNNPPVTGSGALAAGPATADGEGTVQNPPTAGGAAGRNMRIGLGIGL